MDEIKREIKEVIKTVEAELRARPTLYNKASKTKWLDLERKRSNEITNVELVCRGAGRKPRKGETECYEAELKIAQDFLKGDRAEMMLADCAKIRDRVNHNRYTDYQLEKLHENICQSHGSHGHSVVGALQWLHLEPRYQRAAVDQLHSWITASLDIPRAPKQAPVRSYYLDSRDNRKTDEDGLLYHPPVNDEGFITPGFDMKLVSQTDEARQARKLRRELGVMRDPLTGVPVQTRDHYVPGQPVRADPKLMRANIKREKLTEQQRKDRKKHFREKMPVEKASDIIVEEAKE